MHTTRSLSLAVALILSMISSWAQEAKTTAADVRLRISPSVPSGVAFIGEKAIYRIEIQRQATTPLDGELILETAMPGETAQRAVRPLALKGGEMKEETWEPATNRPLYQVLTVSYRSGGKTLATTESAVVVVERPANYGKIDTKSFFATMFVRDPEAAQRIGIKAERIQVQWNVFERTSGTYSWEELDQRLASLREHGVAAVLVVRPELRPKWTAWQSLEELGTPKYRSDFGKFAAAVAVRYREQAMALEIINEPDLDCVKGMTGQLSPAGIYARLLAEAYRAIKEVAPEMPVIGLDVSGVDFPSLRFCEEVLKIDSRAMDIIGAHPYTISRYVGEEARPDSPLSIDTAGRMRKLVELMKSHGMKPRLWPTEFGWGLFRSEPLSSPASQLFAAYAAQAIVLVRTVPEVEKLFWFSMMFPGYESNASYGLFRSPSGPAYPTPAAAAYATCARLLAEVTAVREFDLSASCHVVRFQDTRANRALFILWLENSASVGGGATMSLTGDVAARAMICDGYGRAIEKADAFPLGAMPVFLSVSVSEGDAIEKTLRAAPIQAQQSVVVERAYLQSGNEVALKIANNEAYPKPVKFYPTGGEASARSYKLPVGSSVSVVSLSTPLSGAGKIDIQLFDEKTGKIRAIPIAYHLRPMPKIAEPALDKPFVAPAGVDAISLDQREQILPADPGIDWKGATDLSLTAWMAWTDKGLYLAVKVTDDVHVAGPKGDDHLWSYDSIQVAVDTGNVAEGGYDSHCREFAFALTEAGPRGIETFPDRRALDGSGVSIRRVANTTIYQMLMPWAELGLTGAKSGQVMRLNFIVNDNDGTGRKCWMGPTPGIGEAKQPAAYPQWIFK